MTERQCVRERHATSEYPRKSEGGGESDRDREAMSERHTCNTSNQGRVRERERVLTTTERQ